jgi:hypothetical protein
MIELLLIAQIATGDHYCYMETPTGAVVNLAEMCGVVRQQATVATATAQYERQTLSAIEDQGWDGTTWQVVALGKRYCEQLRGGMTRDEIASEQVDITIGNYGYLDDEPVTVMAAVATYAPEYLCPEFND